MKYIEELRFYLWLSPRIARRILSKLTVEDAFLAGAVILSLPMILSAFYIIYLALTLQF